MSTDKLWLKISSSINNYLRYQDMNRASKELLDEYLYLVLPKYIEDDGIPRYLDKKK